MVDTHRSVRRAGNTSKAAHNKLSVMVSRVFKSLATYTLSGQDEKKNVYRPVSAQYFESASRSKNSPIGMPQSLLNPGPNPNPK